jgi:hypothetical protein
MFELIQELTKWDREDCVLVSMAMLKKGVIVCASNDDPTFSVPSTLYTLPVPPFPRIYKVFIIFLYFVKLLSLYRRFGVSLIDKGAVKTAILSEDVNTLTLIAKDIESMNVLFDFTSNRQTMLHFACNEGKVTSVKTLLKLGANAEIKDGQDWAPIHVAAVAGHLGTLRLPLFRSIIMIY